MKNVSLILLILTLVIVGCSQDAEAGDPVGDPVPVAQVQQCPQPQMMTMMQTRTVYDCVPEEYEVSVQKTRMVPREKTITVMEPEAYTEVQKRVRYNRVARQVQQPVQMMAVPVQQVRMVPVYAAAPKCNLLDRIREHCEAKRAKRAARRASRQMVYAPVAQACPPESYGYGIEK